MSKPGHFLLATRGLVGRSKMQVKLSVKVLVLEARQFLVTDRDYSFLLEADCLGREQLVHGWLAIN